MSDFLKKIDVILSSSFKNLEKITYDSLLNAIKKITNNKITKITKVSPLSPIYNLSTNKIEKAINLITKEMAKDITKLLDIELYQLSEFLGVEVPRLKFLQEVQQNMFNFTSQISQNVRNEFVNYLSVSYIQPSEKQLLEDLATLIQKSVSKTKRLVSEATAQMTREHINKTYQRSLKKEQLFEYVGADDKRTTAICKKHLGLRLTRKQWENIDSGIFIIGLHWGCRHALVPVLAKRKK